MLFRVLSSMISELSERALTLNQVLQLIISEYRIQEFLQEYSDIMIGSYALPVIISGGILILSVVVLFLVVIETIALLALRFAKAGAGFVKVIHQIYMAVCIIYLIMFAYSVFEYVRNRSSILKSLAGSKAAMQETEIILIIFDVICLTVLLLHLCYHKDIAMAMETVSYEIKTETQGHFKRTHLSGISFLFGLPYVLLVFLLIERVSSGYLDLSERIGETLLSGWIYLGGIIILILKHYAVCFCYRNLKQSRGDH